MDLLTKKGPPPETTVDLLLACHARIRHFTLLARKLATADAPDEQLADAARALCRYFGRALPLHSQDEDLSVRPRLETHGVAVRYADAMTAQHEDIHRLLDQLLVIWELVAEGPGLRNAYRDKLEDRSRRLAELFERHLAMEEEHVFPALREVLTPEQDQAIVREMRARREAEPASSVGYFA